MNDNSSNGSLATKLRKFRSNKQPPKKKKSWEETFQELKAYRLEHGHCDVPFRTTTGLGQWVSKQKRVREQLTTAQINKLNSIGFNWNKQDQRHDEKWMEMYRRLQEYKRKYGDCNVINLYKPDPPLGRWVSGQRALNKKGQLRHDRFRLLSRLGFVWHLKDPGDRGTAHQDQAFQTMYDRLVAFEKTHGHCLVPYGYEGDKSLAHFVSNQRTIYKDGEMKPERVQMLEDIGFVWKVDAYSADSSLSQRHWDEMFEELSRFVKDYGHSQVNVYNPPAGYHKKLGTWVRMQRSLHRIQDPSLTLERRQKLESVGFWWGSSGNTHEDEPVLNQQWDDMFQQLTDFHDKYGHTMVRKCDDKKLKNWVGVQRNCYKANKLRSDRKERLEALGFVWYATDKRIDVQWMTMYEKLRDFFHKKGHSNVPSSYTYDQKLARWVSKQRSQASDKEYMTNERKELLNELSFQWVVGIGQYNRDISESEYFIKSRKKKRKREDTAQKPITRTPQSQDDDPYCILGETVAVYWPDDDVYFRGKVSRRGENGRMLIEFEDGDKLWMDPMKDRYRLLRDGGPLPSREVSPDLETVQVGSRISVWWPQEKKFYAANVRKIDPERKRPYLLKYDDGDKEWTHLANRKFLSLDEASSPKKQKREETAQKPKPRTPQSQDDDSYCILGKTVAVYWPDDDIYYRGRVSRRGENGRMLIEYEDGDKLWMDPMKERYRILRDGDPLPSREVSPDLETVQVGSRISVWWPQEKKFYAANVRKIDLKRKTPFKLKYDDGDKEWTHLSNRKFLSLDEASSRT